MPSIMKLKHNRDQQREKLQASIHDAHTLLAQGRQEAGNINGCFTPRLQTNAAAFLVVLVCFLATLLMLPIKSTSAITHKPADTTARLAPLYQQTSVSYGDISFSYDTSLARAIRVETIAAQTNPEMPIAPIHPEYIQFTFEDYPVELLWDPGISLFPVEEFAALGSYEAETIKELEWLLTQRPTLRDMYEYPVYLPHETPLPPYLPLIRNASLGYFLKMDYIDFVGGAGIRYIVGFVQNTAPITSAPLHYTFQGLTNDGQHYIAANFFATIDPSITPPEQPSIGSDIEAHNSYNQKIEEYNQELVQILEQEPASAYTPRLDTLDDVIRSLNTGATESSEQSGETGIDHQASDLTGQIAYIHEGDIYLFDLATGDTRQLTDDGTNRDLAWMPDGEWLAFASNREGNYNIYMMHADGSQQTRLTSDPHDENLPAFSPESTLFFIRRYESGSTGPVPGAPHKIIRKDLSGPEEVVYEIEGSPDGLDARSNTQLALSIGFCCDASQDVILLDLTQPDPMSARVSDYLSDLSTADDGSFCTLFVSEGHWNSSMSRLAFSIGVWCGDNTHTQGLYTLDTDAANPQLSAVLRINVDNEQGPIETPRWSPDDQWLVFASSHAQQVSNGIFIVNAHGGKPQQISAVGSSPAWRPAVAPVPTATLAATNTPQPTETSQAPSRSIDQFEQSAASRIVFTSDRDGNEEIYVMNADGSNQTRLTNDPADDWRAVWSPDGKQIAFLSSRDGNSEIYVMDATGTNLRNVTNNNAAHENYPTWSPDGDRIAYISFYDGNWNVYVMDADGSNQTRLTNTSALDVALSWSPDGNHIAFSSTRDGNNEIYVMNADGTNQTRLTTDSATDWAPEDWAPEWSPDSNRIAFSSDRSGNRNRYNQDIYVMESDGSNQIRLTDDPAVDDNPAWSPDGRYIAFSSSRDGNNEIYVMNADGTNQTRLTDNPGHDNLPDWVQLYQEFPMTPSPLPSNTPMPTAIPEPTDTPVPTEQQELTDTPVPTEQPRDTVPTSEAMPEISLDQLVELPVPAIAQIFEPPDITSIGLLDYGSYDCVPASTTMVVQYLVNTHQISDTTTDYSFIRRLFRQYQSDPNNGISPSLIEKLLPQITNNQATAQVNFFEPEHWQESVVSQIHAGYPIIATTQDWGLLQGNWSGYVPHAFVITGIGDGKVVYIDPWDGQRYEMTFANFETAWSYKKSLMYANYVGLTFTVGQSGTE